MISKIVKRKKYQGIYLPTTRQNESLQDDDKYIESAVEQLDKIACHINIDDSRILDFGCGPGRLASCLMLRYNPAAYLGIDTDIKSIEWCQKWIHSKQPLYKFVHINAHNARYNPAGEVRPVIGDKVAGLFDIVFVNSVFSHMLPDDVEYYLHYLSESTRAGGIVYITAFLEPNVEKVAVNPAGYLGRESVGPLHRVRYNDLYCWGLLEVAGLQPVQYEHRSIKRTEQTEVICKKI